MEHRTIRTFAHAVWIAYGTWLQLFVTGLVLYRTYTVMFMSFPSGSISFDRIVVNRKFVTQTWGPLIWAHTHTHIRLAIWIKILGEWRWSIHCREMGFFLLSISFTPPPHELSLSLSLSVRLVLFTLGELSTCHKYIHRTEAHSTVCNQNTLNHLRFCIWFRYHLYFLGVKAMSSFVCETNEYYLENIESISYNGREWPTSNWTNKMRERVRTE